MYLREAVKGAKDYDSELQALRSSSRGNSFVEEQIKILEKTYKNGIVGLPELNQEFATASENIFKKTKIENPNKSLLDKAALSFSDVVRVRKVKADNSSTKTEDILARAGTALEAGNVGLALKEIENLPASDKEFLSVWMPKATDFVNSQNASEAIFKYVINEGARNSEANG